MIFEPLDAATPLAWSRLRVEGDGALSYLQGQLTQDFEAVPAWSLILEPDGSVISTLWVTRDDTGVDLVVPSALAETVLARLNRFRLRARCEVVLVGPGEAPLATIGERIDAFVPAEAEFAAHLPAQSYGAALVRDAVSFTKGCYTGQELVARLDARSGNVPWRLVRASAPSLEAIDAVLTSRGPAGPSGVTSAMRRGGIVVALGLAHRSLLEASLEGLPIDLDVA
ncbi:MAG: hypothetical protein KGJ39_00745 [Acidobacteriota bacterium]|nr:hypothetical protein [Acidobacteriota bacterium]